MGICTDGAYSVSGCYGGLQALTRNKSTEALQAHCLIPMEALTSKDMDPAMK